MTGREANIAIISTSRGNGSGAESVLIELLRGWDRSGLRLRLVSPTASRVAVAAIEAGIPVVELPTSRDAGLSNVYALAKSLSDIRGATAVHAWHSRGFELALLAGHVLRVPATGSIHDHPDCSTHGRIRRRIIRETAKRLHGLAFVSDAVANTWRPVGVSTSSVTAHNGLVDHQAGREKAGHVRVGFLGMNAPWKGFSVAADWARRTSGPQVRWRFYGDAHPSVTREAEFLSDRADRSIEIVGRKPTEEIFDEIDLLVHASTEFDPYPTVLLEAARAGIPAVASSLGGSGEIVDEGVTGYLFDPQRPEHGFARFAALLASGDLRMQMGRAARARYEREFTVSRMIDRYSKFWSNISR